MIQELFCRRVQVETKSWQPSRRFAKGRAPGENGSISVSCRNATGHRPKSQTACVAAREMRASRGPRFKFLDRSPASGITLSLWPIGTLGSSREGEQFIAFRDRFARVQNAPNCGIKLALIKGFAEKFGALAKRFPQQDVRRSPASHVQNL
jgi:hypothetical protein